MGCCIGCEHELLFPPQKSGNRFAACRSVVRKLPDP
jgi:hypothetical protein